MPKTRRNDNDVQEQFNGTPEEMDVLRVERRLVDLYQQGKITKDECVQAVSVTKLHVGDEYRKLLFGSLREIYSMRGLTSLFDSYHYLSQIVDGLDIKSKYDVSEFMNDPAVQTVIKSDPELSSMYQQEQEIRNEMSSSDARRSLDYGLSWLDSEGIGRGHR